MILWGPPGCGKTTLARLLAAQLGEPLMALSAVMSGVADLRKAFEEARKLKARGRRPILFIDEIHRFNRAQQDGLLHEAEDGTVTLVGATTENPSFALNAGAAVALPRRRPRPAGCGGADEARRARRDRARPRPAARRRRPRAACVDLADGDGRYLLNMVETLADLPPEPRARRRGAWARSCSGRLPVYDKQQEAHYNLISALHKSVRGSDPGRGPLLALPHARGRRGPPLHRAPRRAHGERGHRPRRSPGPAAGPGRRRGLRAAGLARGRADDRPGGRSIWRWRRSRTPPTGPTAPRGGPPRSTAP